MSLPLQGGLGRGCELRQAPDQDLALAFAYEELAAAPRASFVVAPQVVNAARLDAAVVAASRFCSPLRNALVGRPLDQDRYR